MASTLLASQKCRIPFRVAASSSRQSLSRCLSMHSTGRSQMWMTWQSGRLLAVTNPAQKGLSQSACGPLRSLSMQAKSHRGSDFSTGSYSDFDAWDLSMGHGDAYIPSPSNTPTQEDDLLLFRPAHSMWTFTSRPGLDLASLCLGSNMNHVYVILFGVGSRDTEGIYSLRAFNEEGLPQETIIVFESEEDCARYAGLLEATMDHVPAVCSIPPRELLEFCQESGYLCRVEPSGSLLIPPDFNVRITDWERSMRLREGQFSVLEAEPEPTISPGCGRHHTHVSSLQVTEAPHRMGLSWSAAPLPQQVPQAAADNLCTSLAKYHPNFSDDQLAEVKRKLELLLPPSDSDEEEDAFTSPPPRAAASWDLPKYRNPSPSTNTTMSTKPPGGPVASPPTHGNGNGNGRCPASTDSSSEEDLTPPPRHPQL